MGYYTSVGYMYSLTLPLVIIVSGHYLYPGMYIDKTIHLLFDAVGHCVFDNALC